MENVLVLERPIGSYKVVQLQCTADIEDNIEFVQYPDGDILVSINSDEGEVILTKSQLEKLLEELK